ncbi:uncharacterized protein [Phaseolus vulgaris]|uniref:uncharacterized protein n=1 Tax=Phaseolus vulgaris TaxID=3885 RepID=UPI0035CC8EC8
MWISYTHNMIVVQAKKSNEESLPEIVPAKCIPFLDQFPVGYHPYIVDVVDVKADGYCGYCAVVAQLEMGEESWAVVRMNLLKELSEWRQEYVQLFGGDDRYEYLKKSLLVEHMSMAETNKWMAIPDMGYVIANRYNVILVSLSMLQSLSIFPLRTQAPSNSRHHRIIAIGHVHENHFVQVKLKDDCPIPPTDILWASHPFGTVLHNYEEHMDDHIRKSVKCLRMAISGSQNFVYG